MYMSSPVLVGGRLVGFTEKRSGQLFALDPEDRQDASGWESRARATTPR